LTNMEQLLTRYAELLAGVDRWFAGCAARYQEQIACARGCSHCCRGLFDITLLDAALLRSGFKLLPLDVRKVIAEKAAARIEGIRNIWPEFGPPYLLNSHPEEEWDRVMPEDDETPCVLLGTDGLCLLYDYRPLTCRLHGLPLVDRSGEVMDDGWCPLNFPAQDPLDAAGLRGGFAKLFRKETALLSLYNALAAGLPTAQLDTLIPAALLIDPKFGS
jgi:Fe-S-cluster containining protein